MLKNDELTRKFSDKEELRNYLFKNASQMHRYEAGKVLYGLNDIEDGQYSIYDIIKRNSQTQQLPDVPRLSGV